MAASANGIVYTGNTHIRLNSANTMDVHTWNAVTKKWVTTTGAGLPANGVVYVEGGTGGCALRTRRRSPTTTQAEPKSCGTLYLTGTYSSSLTFGADQDIIIGSQIDSSHRNLIRNPSSDGVVGRSPT